MIRVLDTSVLVYDPTFLDSYPGDDLVLPLTVIRELDGMKSSPAHPGPAARAAVRALDELSAAGPSDGAAAALRDRVVEDLRSVLADLERRVRQDHSSTPRVS